MNRGDTLQEAQLELQMGHPEDGAVEVTWRGRTLLRYSYGDTYRPYCHPVCLPDGRCVTLAQPHDHVWHSGLYHCPKFVDEYSLWEPELHIARSTGRSPSPLAPDHHGTGAYGWLETIDICQRSDSSTAIGFDAEVRWRGAAGEILGHERQRWTVHAPRDDCRAYLIALDLELTAEGRDRRLWAGQHGYSGFSWRSPRAMDRGMILSDRGEILAPDGQNIPARWVDYTGAADGHGLDPLSGAPVGAVHYEDPNRYIGIALFSHPANQQSSFFALGRFGFLAAHLGHPEPLLLKAGEPLRARYGALVHAWPGDRERIEPFFNQFLRTCSSQ
jgi:hypothetical protein